MAAHAICHTWVKLSCKFYLLYKKILELLLLLPWWNQLVIALNILLYKPIRKDTIGLHKYGFSLDLFHLLFFHQSKYSLFWSTSEDTQMISLSKADNLITAILNNTDYSPTTKFLATLFFPQINLLGCENVVILTTLWMEIIYLGWFELIQIGRLPLRNVSLPYSIYSSKTAVLITIYFWHVLVFF